MEGNLGIGGSSTTKVEDYLSFARGIVEQQASVLGCLIHGTHGGLHSVGDLPMMGRMDRKGAVVHKGHVKEGGLRDLDGLSKIQARIWCANPNGRGSSNDGVSGVLHHKRHHHVVEQIPCRVPRWVWHGVSSPWMKKCVLVMASLSKSLK